MEPKIEHFALEQDIERLSKEIQEHKATLSKPGVSDREIVKAVLGAQIQRQSEKQSIAQPPSSILPKYLESESAEVKLKVEELVDLAFHKGIGASVKEANKFGPFILDALHDSLTGRIYDELKVRKLL